MYGLPVLRAERRWCAWMASGSVEVAEGTVAANLFAAGAPIPQGAGGLYEEARRWIEITRASVEQSPVMSIHDSQVLTASTWVQAIRTRDQANRRQRSDANRSVQGPQH
jgi:hypothetical protein